MRHYFFFFLFVSLRFNLLHGRSDDRGFPVGRRISIPFPPAYEDGLKASAVFLGGDDAGTRQPGFKAALSMEAADGGFSCSLVVLLGDVKVWASDHFSKFRAGGACVAELTMDGDLQVKDRNGLVGWSSGTPGLGVKSLQIQKKSGNLVLIDAKNRTRWQSFDFPTDTLLWSQQLNASTPLTTAAPNSSAIYYSLEIHGDKLGLYLNFKDQKYSYWELDPPSDESISFIRLGSRGLKLFDKNARKIGQVLATGEQAVRFMALGGTGNLELYHAGNSYTDQVVFESSYRAIEDSCSLPLPCGLSGVCTRSLSSGCLHLPMPLGGYSGFCDGSYNSETQMVELEGVDTVLGMELPKTNSTMEGCVTSCMDDCLCAAALYRKQACFRYELVAGAREVGTRTESNYWVKVPKDASDNNGIYSSLVKKILLFGEVVDTVALCCILGGILYWILKIRQKRRERSETDNN